MSNTLSISNKLRKIGIPNLEPATRTISRLLAMGCGLHLGQYEWPINPGLTTLEPCHIPSGSEQLTPSQREAWIFRAIIVAFLAIIDQIPEGANNLVKAHERFNPYKRGFIFLPEILYRFLAEEAPEHRGLPTQNKELADMMNNQEPSFVLRAAYWLRDITALSPQIYRQTLKVNVLTDPE